MKRDPDSMERWITRLLREQRPRRAPASLPARVLEEIQRREAGARAPAGTAAVAPWWRRSFAYWPLAAKVAFTAASLGTVWLALSGLDAAGAALRSDSNVGSMVLVLRGFAGFCETLAATAATVAHAIPQSLLYIGIAVCGSVYFALFGLGTIAYRTLYTPE